MSGSTQSTNLIRPEYPRPILKRPLWLNLNGEWGFAEDPDNGGLKSGWQHRAELPGKIRVPFSVEASASGIGKNPAAPVVWYRRSFEVPSNWQSMRLLLHVGAADYATRVFINGAEAGQNEGGYAPFSFDITHLITKGVNQITIRCEDGLSWSQPRGKQEGTTRWPIDYDGVTGIWQTVWLEPLGETYIQDVSSGFRLQDKSLRFTAGLNDLFSGSLDMVLSHNSEVIAQHSVSVSQRSEIKTLIDLDNSPAGTANRLPLWSQESPNLCDLKLTLRDSSGEIIDQAASYIGLREIGVVDGQLQLNGEPLYIRGVLDQGYFPNGWYTAVADEDYRRDIELTLAMGFNCARKHQKAEDPRYLYWADRLGLLIWSEMPSGRVFSTDLVRRLTDEWVRLIRRDRAHPSIIAWVPFNESWGVWNQEQRPEQRAFVDALTSLTRALDTTRLIVGNDGWEYSSGDLWTLHIYEGDAQPFAERLAQVLASPQSKLQTDGRVGALEGANVEGLPVLLTECGGVGYQAEDSPVDDAFAYGDLPTSRAELLDRISKVASEVHSAAKLQGFVWTQLTDVQQEINGLLTFNRRPKLPVEALREIFSAIGLSGDSVQK